MVVGQRQKGPAGPEIGSWQGLSAFLRVPPARGGGHPAGRRLMLAVSGTRRASPAGRPAADRAVGAGRHRSCSSAIVSAVRSTAYSRTAPCPARACSPSASGCRQPTSSARPAPVRSRAGATQAVYPPGANGASTLSTHARASRATLPDSAANHPVRPSRRAAVTRSGGSGMPVRARSPGQHAAGVVRRDGTERCPAGHVGRHHPRGSDHPTRSRFCRPPTTRASVGRTRVRAGDTMPAHRSPRRERVAGEGMRMDQPERTYKVGYFVGSLSSNSINRTLSRALIRLARGELEFTEIPIGNLPLYSPDHDTAYPPEATALKEAIAASDAVLFVTPEYNRSIPGALKNAIDWASRPWGQNSFHHIPAGVIGASIGAIGTAVAQQSLRAVLSFCNARQMTSPEAYITFSPERFRDDGEVLDEATATFLRDYMAEFRDHVVRVLTVLPRP